MKSEFLKLAGVSNIKEFYAKFPDEASFFKAYPQAKKMIKKAQAGTVMSGMSSYLQGMQNVPNMQNVIQGQTQSPGVNAGMFPGNNTPDYNRDYMNMSLEDEQLKPFPKKESFGQSLAKQAGTAGQLIGGYEALRAGRRAKKEAQMWANVTDVQAQASETQDIDDYRQYAENANRKRNAFMPVTTGEEFFPTQGVGTNVLSAREGARLQRGGEIQNTYAPGTLYDDLGYEPLDDSNQVKQFVYGGGIPKAIEGMEMLGASGGGTPWGAIGGMGSKGAASLTGNDGGGQIGGAIGGAAGMAIGGPAGQAIGSTIGTLAGGLLDTNDIDQRKAEADIKYDIGRIKTSQYGKANQSYLSSIGVAENGININPQIISQFGGNNLMSLLAPPNDADMLRAGGHIRGRYVEPNQSGLSTMEQGGDLATHWGGYAEPMSYNPYLPGGGETVMFRGQSHDESDGMGNTGIGVSYGNTNEANVEVERGEPAVKLKDGGTGEENLTVYGNLMIPKYGIDLLGDSKAKGKKFKNYVADLSKIEARQNSLVEKSTNKLNELKPIDSFDKLELASLEANIKGGNMKLKEIADKKIKAADLQNAINETAEEYGLVADDLARGKTTVDKKAMKLREAMFGTKLTKAQDGDKVKSVSALKEVPKGQRKSGIYYGKVTQKDYEKLKEQNPWYDWNNFDPSDPKDVLDFQTKFNKLAEEVGADVRIKEDEKFGEQTASADSRGFIKRERGEDMTAPEITSTKKDAGETDEENTFETIEYKQNPYITAFNEVLPFLRPSNQEELNPQQLLGEMYAMSSNQLEPVQAQPYSPQLRVPYDISMQDQLNEITADQRAAQRMTGYNPAAQANLAAQTYGAKSSVLANQFRANQAMKDQVYSGNIATLNDAQLKNLAIYDQQYGRQEQAKSNTKATSLAALNSISDKYAKNALENRTLGVYENLYNYRYDKSGRAINMNPLYQANIPQMYNPGQDPNYILS
jgi:hypothetical protein